MNYSIKDKYAKNKLYQRNIQDEKILSHRNDFGIRDIETFFLFAKYFFPDSILNKSYAKNNLSLVDIGCGDQYIKYGCDKYGMKYFGYDYLDCDIENDSIPNQDKSVDIVICLALLEHLKDPSNLISEAWRVLKENGLLILSTPNWRYSLFDFFDDPTHIRPYTYKSLEYILKSSNFGECFVVPNLRCQKKSYYLGKAAFFNAAFLRPFRNSPKNKFIPAILKGKARGLFGITIKKNSAN